MQLNALKNIKPINLFRTLFILVVIAILSISLYLPFKLNTDLTSLVTAGQSLPIKNLMQRYSSFIQVVVAGDDLNAVKAKANQFYTSLDLTKFKAVKFKIDGSQQQQIITSLQHYQNSFVSKSDLKLLQQKQYDQIENNSLYKLSTSLLPPIVSLDKDPFGLFSNYLMSLLKTPTKWTLKDGYLWQQVDSKNYIFISIELHNDNSLKDIPTIQKVITLANNISDAKASVHLSGAPIHTAITTEKSEGEINILSLISLCSSFLFIYLLFRNLKYIIPITATIGLAFVVGFAVDSIVFSSIHILTFVFGTSLVGISLDYAFHYLKHEASKQELLKNMLSAYLTTSFCFTPLLFSQLSILKQIALFTIVGLTVVYLSVILFYSLMTKPSNKSFFYFNPPIAGKKIKATILGLFVISVGYTISQINFQNNITSMYKPEAKLLAEDKFFQQLNGFNFSEMMLIKGNNLEQVLQKEEALKQHNDFNGISNYVASIKQQQQNQSMIAELFKHKAQDFKQQLGADNDFIMAQSKLLDEEGIKNNILLKNFYDQFILSSNGEIYSITPINGHINVGDVTGVYFFNAKTFLAEELDSFAQQAYYFLAISFSFLLIILGVIYRRKIITYIMPSIISIGFVLFCLTIFNQSITFFHLISLFIVIGVGIDYTIFHMNSGRKQNLETVLFSFLTSLIGFGLLSFTSFALMQSMGVVLGLGLSCSYLVSLFIFRKNDGES